jgi:hypothetical protein
MNLSNRSMQGERQRSLMKRSALSVETGGKERRQEHFPHQLFIGRHWSVNRFTYNHSTRPFMPEALYPYSHAIDPGRTLTPILWFEERSGLKPFHDYKPICLWQERNNGDVIASTASMSSTSLTGRHRHSCPSLEGMLLELDDLLGALY